MFTAILFLVYILGIFSRLREMLEVTSNLSTSEYVEAAVWPAWSVVDAIWVFQHWND